MYFRANIGICTFNCEVNSEAGVHAEINIRYENISRNMVIRVCWHYMILTFGFKVHGHM